MSWCLRRMSLVAGRLPSKHKTFVQHLYNVGPTSSTLVQHCTNCSFPDFDDPVSGAGDDKALGSLADIHVRDDVVVACWGSVRTPPGNVVGGGGAWLAVRLLHHLCPVNQARSTPTQQQVLCLKQSSNKLKLLVKRD